jgi:hypothetical protein
MQPEVLIPLAGKAFSTTLYSISLPHERFDVRKVRGWGAREKLGRIQREIVCGGRRRFGWDWRSRHTNGTLLVFN